MVIPHEELLIFLQGGPGNLLRELDDDLVVLVDSGRLKASAQHLEAELWHHRPQGQLRGSSALLHSGFECF